MHKLIILIEPPRDRELFEDSWPQFLHHAERMPGLKREATIRVQNVLFGSEEIDMIHELYFDSVEELREAMASEEGQQTGAVLQRMTGGRMTLLVAEHKEDDIENIRKYHKDDESSTPDPD